MANEIKRLLVEEDYLIIILDNSAQFPPNGEDKYIYMDMSDTTKSKHWDYLTKTWVDITVATDDIIKIAKIDDLPTTAPTNKDSLYLIAETKVFYQWVEDEGGLNGRFVFLASSVSMQRVMVNNLFCKYVASPVTNNLIQYGIVRLNSVYQAKNDNEGFYIIDIIEPTKKLRIPFDLFLMLFQDVKGRTFEDIFGSYVPISDKPQNYMEQIRDIKSLLDVLDKDRNGISDESQNSRRLEGKSLAWIMAEVDKKVSNVSIDLTPITNQINALNTSKMENVSLKNNNTVVGGGTILNFSKDFLVVKDTTDPKQLNIVKPIDINSLKEANNFTNTVGDNGLSINYSWINSNADGFSKTVLFVSKNDISNIDYMTCVSDSTGTIVRVKQSTSIGIGDVATTRTESLTKYYSKIFTVYIIDGIQYATRGLTLTIETKDDTPPMPISNLSIIQETKDSAKLTWNNPTDTRFRGVSIIRKLNNFPSDEHDGQEIYRGNDTSFIDNGLELNKIYFYKAFSYSLTNKYASSVTSQVQFSLDNIAPNSVTNASVTKGYQLLKLKWTGSNSSDVKKTILLRKVGTVGSATPEDGSLILTLLASENNKYQNTYFTDGGLANGETYTYTWFVYDKYDNISTSVSVTGQTSTDLIPELQMFKTQNLDNGTKVKITWTNPSVIPTGLTFLEREVYYTTSWLVDLNTMNREQCLADTSNLIKLTNGMGQGVGKAENFELTNLSYGDVAQFKTFCKYNNGVNDIWTIGEVFVHIVKDETPPTNITDLTYLGGDSQITINWKNPIDTDFAKVEIYRKLGDYPTGLIVSEKVHTSTNQNIGNTNTFVDSGLENDKTYYYQMIVYDTHDNVNKETKFTVATLALQAYTVEYNLLTDTITRKDLSSGKTVADLLATILYQNQGKRCLLKDDGNVNYYLDPNDSSKKENGQPSVLDGTDGQVVSEFNKFWVKVAMKDSTTLICSVSPTALVGYNVAPMFISNGVTYDKVYISCFESYKNTTTNKLESRIGVLPTTNLDVATTRVLAKARGTNWSCWNRHALDCIRILYMVLYANGNSQATIGKGIVNDTTIHQNGETVSMGNKNGTTATIEDGKHAISLFGLENLWGNIYEFIDGIVITDTNAYVTDYNYESFTSPSSLGSYKQITGFNPYGGYSGFVNGLYFTNSYPTMFFGSKFTGSDSTYTCDFTINKQPNGFAYQYSGFKYDADTKAGIFATAYINSNINATTKDFSGIAGGLEGSGSYQKIIFNKTIDGAPDGIKNLTSLFIDDTNSIFKLNLSYEMSNVGSRLMVLK